ncbi:MAG: hypothetical protein ACM3PE_05645, partial [Deltaproteobacteria bacterium]
RVSCIQSDYVDAQKKASKTLLNYQLTIYRDTAFLPQIYTDFSEKQYKNTLVTMNYINSKILCAFWGFISIAIF